MEHQSPQPAPGSIEYIRQEIQKAQALLGEQSSPNSNQNTLPTAPNAQPTPNKVQDETFAGQSRSFIEGTRADIKAQNLSKKELRAFASEAADAALVDEDPRSAKYAADHLSIYKLLTASDKRFEEMMDQPDGAERSKKSGKLDDADVPAIGDMSLAKLKAARQTVSKNPAGLTEEVNKEFPTPDPKDRQYNRKFDQRQKYNSLLRMGDDEFNKEAAKWGKRAARNAKKEAKRSEHAARRESRKSAILSDTEVDTLLDTGHGLVGGFAEMGWDPSDLDVALEYNEAVKTQGANADPTEVKTLIKKSVNAIDHESPAAKHDYAKSMEKRLAEYVALDEAEREEVNAALNKYWDHEDALAEKNERLASRLRAKALGARAMVGVGIVKTTDYLHDNRKLMSKAIREGFSRVGNTDNHKERLSRTKDRAKLVGAGAVRLAGSAGSAVAAGASYLRERADNLRGGNNISLNPTEWITRWQANRVVRSNEKQARLDAMTDDEREEYLKRKGSRRLAVGATAVTLAGLGFSVWAMSKGMHTGGSSNTASHAHEAFGNGYPGSGATTGVHDHLGSLDLGPNEQGVNGQFPSVHELHVAHQDHVKHLKHLKHIRHAR